MTFEGYNEVNGAKSKSNPNGGQKTRRKGSFKEAMAMFGGFSRQGAPSN